MELLCIQTHSQKAVLAGNIYPLISDKSPCKCKVYDVGISATKCPNYINSPLTQCLECNTIHKNDGIWWISAELFAQIGKVDECEQYEVKEHINL